LQELSPLTTGIDVITRRMLESHWGYPDNVKLHYVNKTNYKGFGIEALPVYKKLWHFITFVQQLRRTVLKEQSCILIVHDVIPLFAAYLLRDFLKRRGVKLWYHNHDVTDRKRAGQWTLMGIATKFEAKAFPLLDCFSLPAKERLIYFPIQILKYKPLIIPNYPLKRFYKQTILVSNPNNTLKLVYQGSIGPGHGLETVISILNTKIRGKQLELHLVGKIRPAYKAKLMELALQYKVTEYFKDHGMQPFVNLPKYLSQFDVGLAIHEPYNVTYATGGSASNKIYEYAACGLPVLLIDNDHYKSYLAAYKWAFFTSLEKETLINVIEKVVETNHEARTAALKDFQSTLNYEVAFAANIDTIKRYLLN
jgi:glycosyltransferase involved in cell wall biosynthesis